METQINKLALDLYSPKFDIVKAKEDWNNLRKHYQSNNNEQFANYAWLALQIIDIHHLYRGIHFKLDIKNTNIKKYYNAWCDAEQIELIASNITRNFPVFLDTIALIINQVHIIQSLFPYKLFTSTEILIKEERCSICGATRNVFKPCGHQKGHVYNGKLCYNTVTRCDIVGLSLVTNPVKKYAVVFQQDKRGNEIEYSYNYIDALMYYWQKPYQFWNYYVIDNNIGNVIRFYKI